jgi:hypothetical protein
VISALQLSHTHTHTLSLSLSLSLSSSLSHPLSPPPFLSGLGGAYLPYLHTSTLPTSYSQPHIANLSHLPHLPSASGRSSSRLCTLLASLIVLSSPRSHSLGPADKNRGTPPACTANAVACLGTNEWLTPMKASRSVSCFDNEAMSGHKWGVSTCSSLLSRPHVQVLAQVRPAYLRQSR